MAKKQIRKEKQEQKTRYKIHHNKKLFWWIIFLLALLIGILIYLRIYT